MKKALFAVIMVFSILIISSACVGDSDIVKEIAYDSTEITYSESTAQYGFRVNMDFAETAFAKYFFESSIDNKEREACIAVTEKVLSNQILEDVLPEIYVFSKDRYASKLIRDNKLYCSIQDWKSVEYVTDILLATYGETVHYGIAFGYANYLAQANKWKTNIDVKFSNPSVKDVLDLNYLCFDEDFATPNDVIIVKEIACDFADSYISRHGEKAIQQLLSSPSEALNALSSYYADKGISYIPSAIQFVYGGKSYAYMVFSDYGTFYIGKDWVDMNAEYNPLITNGFLHSNYADTKAFFEINIEQMKLYQDLFNLDNYNNDLDIIFTNPISASKCSFYQSVIHRIYLYNVDSLMHEYIHSLTTTNTSMAMWKVEGFARYFSYYYDFYGMPFLNQDYNNTSNTPTTQYVHEYLAAINRPIDMAKDYCELENVAVHYFNFTNPNANYLAGSSFVQYLVKQYGEDAVINSIYGNGDPLPKIYAELVKEWNEFIEANYSNYSKYKQ